VNVMTIQHNKPTLGGREILAAASSLRSGWVAQGPQVQAFERDLCSFLGLPEGHAVCVSSGTAALALALHVLGAKGRRVAMPVYACSSLRHAVLFAQALEEIHDVEECTPNVDIRSINASSPDIAIVPHMYGIPADILKISKDIRVVEDCAQAIGARIGNAAAGTVGDISIFSFYASKLLTSGGQGGAVISKDRAIADAVRDYRTFDGRRDTKSRFNFQMSDVLAAIGRSQLKRLPKFLNRRASLFEEYRAAGLDLLDVLPGATELKPVRFRAVLRTANPEALISALSKRNVSAIVPTESWELLGDASSYPQALDLCNTTVSLPLYPLMRKRDVKKIAKWSQCA